MNPDVAETAREMLAEGARGFHASALAKRAGCSTAEAVRVLDEMVAAREIETRAGVMCFLCGQTILQGQPGEPAPIGRTVIHSSCDEVEVGETADTVVSEGDIWRTWWPVGSEVPSSAVATLL